jgi:uncharacterized Fe-S center protein
MKSKVYYCSAQQTYVSADETLPKKLEAILSKLEISNRVKDESVAIKMHLGSDVGYSTIHPVLVRKVVEAVLAAGGKPFVTDVLSSCKDAYKRGYSQETLGCPIYPIGGPDDKYFYTKQYKYKSVEEWLIGGALHNASFLIDLAHVKGHPSCSYGGAIKNIAIGGLMGKSRGAMHDLMHYDKYWFYEKCQDDKKMKEIIDSCPISALTIDKNDSKEIHMHFEDCNQCGKCLEVAPKDSLKIDKINFDTFQIGCAISTHLILSTFEKEKSIFINIANQITPVCDCFGFTGANILPDIGIFGSNDIVAVEQATLDEIKKYKIIKENVPVVMKLQKDVPHPLQELHGRLKDPYLVVDECEKLNLGSKDYELIDIMPLEEPKFGAKIFSHISAH